MMTDGSAPKPWEFPIHGLASEQMDAWFLLVSGAGASHDSRPIAAFGLQKKATFCG